MAEQSSQKPRRSRTQAAKDDKALQYIVETVQNANRFDLKSLRETLDRIGDVLIEAGRL